MISIPAKIPLIFRNNMGAVTVLSSSTTVSDVISPKPSSSQACIQLFYPKITKILNYMLIYIFIIINISD